MQIKPRWSVPLAAATAAALLFGMSACSQEPGGGSEAPSGDAGALKIGLTVDLSGVGSMIGTPGKMVAELAVEEINAAGGVNGQQLELVVADNGGLPQNTKTAATRLVESDQVAALFAPVDSASRDAAMPTVVDADIPFFYPTLTEGQVCAPYLFSTANTPQQQLQETIPVVQELEGKTKWFLIGNDYVYPRTSLEAAREFNEAAGGEVVGEEYVPLGTTDFQAVISQIRSSDAELLLPVVVGADTVAFEKQAYDAGIGANVLPRLTISYDDNTMAALGQDIAQNMYVGMGYDMDLDTPENRAFVEAYRAKFGDSAPAVTAYSIYVYATIKAWADAVTTAGSTALADVAEAIVGQVNTTPAGEVTILDNRYAQESIHLIKYVEGGEKEFVQTFDNVIPAETCSVS